MFFRVINTHTKIIYSWARSSSKINLYNPYLLVRYAICSLSFDESSAIVVSVRLLMTSRRLVTGIPIFWFCTRTLTEYFCFLRYLLRLVEHVVFFPVFVWFEFQICNLSPLWDALNWKYCIEIDWDRRKNLVAYSGSFSEFLKNSLRLFDWGARPQRYFPKHRTKSTQFCGENRWVDRR